MSEEWDYRAYWDELVRVFKERLSGQEYMLWFSRIQYLKAEENLIHLSVPSLLILNEAKKRFQDPIQQFLLELSGLPLSLVFEIVPLGKSTEKTGKPTIQAEARNEQVAAPAQNRAGYGSNPRIIQTKPNLNADYSFDNFVIGDNNSFAANAAMAISRDIGMAYNPFLIYGGVGLGKTHLLQSIGNYVWERQPEKKTMYVQMESFTNEFIQCIKDKSQSNFKAKYRNVDLLLIDDIHFIQGKTETQEELFYTFNALYDYKKQMVFTCDRPVSEFKDLTDRLRSRFERGLNVDLQPPSYETRFAILRKKVEIWGIDIPEEALHIICQNITTNVRDLEKALTKLRAYVELVDKRITAEITRQQLKDFFSTTGRKNITIDLIIREVASYFNLTLQDLKNKRRHRSVAFPRQIAMYISREITEFSTTEIGIEFGGRDHTTVMHGCQSVSEKMKSDSSLEPLINELVRKIRSEGTRS